MEAIGNDLSGNGRDKKNKVDGDKKKHEKSLKGSFSENILG